MFKLIQLEIKKYKMRGSLKGALIANLIIFTFLVIGVIGSKINNEIPFRSWDDIFFVTGTFVRATFMIFAAALISKLVIGEYKTKTINVLFTYPVNRKKIMLAKLIVVAIFTFASMVISHIFLSSSLFILNIFSNFIQESLTVNIIIKDLINIILYSATFSFISLIPAYVGIRRKSGSSIIITSIILVSLLNSGSKGYNLSTIIIIPIILAIIGAGCSYLYIKDVEKVDVDNF